VIIVATKIPIDIELNQSTVNLLNNLKNHARHVSLKNSFRVIGISYRKEVKGIFERKQTRDASLRWPPLSPETEKQKERLGYGDKPMLVRTEKLKKSMTTVGAEGNISYYGDTNAFFGSEIDYGVYHDNLDEERSKIPLRNFSQPSESTYGSWLNTINSDLKGQLKSKGIIVD